MLKPFFNIIKNRFSFLKRFFYYISIVPTKNNNQTLKIMRKLLLVLVGVFALNFQVKAQNDGIESILLASGDAEKLVSAYINPAMTGLIYGMNNGWYHTAKVHKVFGFDLSIGLNASLVPSEDEIFSFASLGLSGNTTSTSLTGATVAGSEDLQVPVTFSGTVQGQNVSATFNMPGGVKEKLPINAIPSPSVQFNMGLPWKTEVMIRATPQINSDDVSGKLLGLGLKKEITDWFGPLEKTPLHVSLLASFTTMNIDYNIQNESSINGMNQQAEFKLNSYNVEAIASLNFPVINIFGGIGYSSGSSELNMLGTYELEYDTGQPAPNDTVTETVVDPLNLDFDASGFKTTVGARLSLGFFKIFGSYTLQEYNTINAGIAFSFR